MILFLNPLVSGLVLALILQKRRWVDYGSDDDELERMLAELEGGSDPTAGDESRRAASSVMSERSESSNPIDFAQPVEPLTFKYWVSPPRSKSSERRSPRRMPPGMCLRLKRLHSE